MHDHRGSLFDLSTYLDVDVDERPPQLDMPGGDDFFDVTQVFADAAKDIAPGQVLLMEGYDLQQAMAVFEIGDPKLDSGMTPEGHDVLKFDPAAPLLPEELCWIMDRSLAYEMQWHAGNSLSHTVYTLCYVHHLSAIDPDSMRFSRVDPSRPIELITILLRAYVLGLLKCCDLSWRELNNLAVREIEDWQSDKCEVSLQEGVPLPYVLLQLEKASTWINNAVYIPAQWRQALLERLLLRKATLHLLSSDLSKDPSKFHSLLASARARLAVLRSNPAPEPQEGSPAHSAFDPYVTRRLAAYVPVCVVEVPGWEEVGKRVEGFLDGWGRAVTLAGTPCLRAWEIAGDLGRYRPPPLAAYLRSSIQNTFYNGVFVLNDHPPSWLVNRFFVESLGVRYDALRARLALQCTPAGGARPPPWQDMERLILKLLVPHIRANWANLPRHRRTLAKSLVGWHKLYDILREIASCHRDATIDEELVDALPTAALVWRLGVIREIVLSGFQLELYAPDERPFAYWYVAHVAERHLECIERLTRVVPDDSEVAEEMRFQVQMLTGVQLMCTSLFTILQPSTPLITSQTEANFTRRYKWAFRPEYGSVAHPRLAEYLGACAEAKKVSHFFFWSPL
ncbi:hypothetical protein HGRIS_013796 [Hohenbuehelia grisea]|uniref:Uncharacterized protein n=1 Tax=Hohenbuehelia grisea TaxID=104357 RepID=A0ABR3IWY1_9AGAR